MKIEIEKPVIPKFVADWIEFCKDGGVTVYGAITDNLSNSMMDWLFNEEKVDDFAKAWVIGYEVEQEPLYYAKSKLTGQYLGNKDIGIGSCVQQPFWFFDKGHLQIEKLPKEAFKKVYGLDDTNTYFERVE